MMIKPMECPRCRKEPAYGFYSDDGNNKNVTYEVFCYGADCKSKIGSITAKTYIGAVLKWNAHCRRELRRIKKEKKEK